ncbi:Uma2 family endonuclease [Streptomyces sp. NPDC047046]|uniref:Uma2 family endonuclease n=1 Tax=Streptomyces sp. NPDC047046 TaxID=3155378 RepID=UPI0033F6EC3E
MTADSPQDAGYRWPVPPPGGWTVEDLFTLPDLPPHTELLDGSLIFVSPQRRFHLRMIDLLVKGLSAHAPAGLVVEREMTVVLDPENAPEPDVLVASDETEDDMNQVRYTAADLTLVIEVVSPESRRRDTRYKPVKYAEAGIPHFWLVEQNPNDLHPVVRTYELDPLTNTYSLTGIHHERLKLSSPFDMDIDITGEALRKVRR